MYGFKTTSKKNLLTRKIFWGVLLIFFFFLAKMKMQMEAIIFLWMCVEIYSLLDMWMKLTHNENLIFFSSRYANFFFCTHLELLEEMAINQRKGWKNAILIEANTNKVPTQKAGN